MSKLLMVGIIILGIIIVNLVEWILDYIFEGLLGEQGLMITLVLEDLCIVGFFLFVFGIIR